MYPPEDIALLGPMVLRPFKISLFVGADFDTGINFLENKSLVLRIQNLVKRV